MYRESWDWNERALSRSSRCRATFLGRRAFKLWIRGQASEADKVSDQLRGLYPTDHGHGTCVSTSTRSAVVREPLSQCLMAIRRWSRPGVRRGFGAHALEALEERFPGKDRAKREQACIAGARTSPQMATEGGQVMGALGEIDTGIRHRQWPASFGAAPMSSGRSPARPLAARTPAWRIGTQWMFTPSVARRCAPIRASSRCATAIGLTDYWRKRGVKPDYQATLKTRLTSAK